MVATLIIDTMAGASTEVELSALTLNELRPLVLAGNREAMALATAMLFDPVSQGASTLVKVRLPRGVPRDWIEHPWTHGWVWHGPLDIGAKVPHDRHGVGRVTKVTKTRIHVEFPDGKTRTFLHAKGVEESGKAPAKAAPPKAPRAPAAPRVAAVKATPAKTAPPTRADVRLTPGKGGPGRGGGPGGQYWHITDADGKRLGHVYVNIIDEPPIGRHASMSIQVNKNQQGRGVGSAAYRLAAEASGHDTVYLHMRKSNIASRKSAARAGFTDAPELGGRQHAMVWRRPSGRTATPPSPAKAAPTRPAGREVMLNPRKAKTYKPVDRVKHAEIVDAPPDKETVITPEWGGEQRFKGRWVRVLGPDGKQAYGSAHDEWMAMHEPVPGVPGGWRKTATVDAHQHTGPAGHVRTTLADGTRETTRDVHPGDWVVRQRNGEVQVITDAKFRQLYDADSPQPLAPAKRAPAKRVSAATAKARVARSAKSRAGRPGGYPRRQAVPDDKASWDSDYPDYDPPEHTDPLVLANDRTKRLGGWADPPDVSRVGRRFISREGPVRVDGRGRPLNPYTRTGIQGRGLLGRWGANPAADPVITRVNPETGQLEVAVIRRGDGSHQWAIPGGMVNEGETAPAALAREFREETGADLDMGGAAPLYRGYVDDPRNTDNAWIETTAMHRHLSPREARAVRFGRPDDSGEVKGVRWAPVDGGLVDDLYASHGDLVVSAVRRVLADDNGLGAGERARLAMVVARVKAVKPRASAKKARRRGGKPVVAALTKARARDLNPDAVEYRHWWIPLGDILTDTHQDLPSTNTLHTLTRDNGDTHLTTQGHTLHLHADDADHLATETRRQLDHAPSRHHEPTTILTAHGDVEIGRHHNGVELRFRDADGGQGRWLLPDDDAAALADHLDEIAAHHRPPAVDTVRVSPDLAWNLMGDGSITATLADSATSEPPHLGPPEAIALADALDQLARKRIPVITGPKVGGLRRILLHRDRAEHAEAAHRDLPGGIRVGWWSDGLVTIEVPGPGGVTEIQLTASDAAKAAAELRRLATRAHRADKALRGWLGKRAGADLADDDLTLAVAELLPVEKAAYAGRGTPAGKWRARHLHRYWTKGPGLARWVNNPHPWTTLYTQLSRYIKNPNKAKRVTSQWFRDATGIWPGSRYGSNPTGPG